MCKVAVPERLASARVVYFGEHGQISRHALQRKVSRQRLYREADSVLRDLEGAEQRQLIDSLRQQINDLQTRLDRLRTQQPQTVVVSFDLQAEFACTAQAEGVSLPVARRLLAVFLKEQTPSVAALGRATRQAAKNAGAVLAILDEHTRPLVRQAAGDELFFGQKPVLMVVEPQSHCWVAGRISPSREGEQWQKELAALPNLEHLARDGGTGLEKGVALVNEQRTKNKQALVGDQLDHFHTLREGRRGLRQTQARAERAWTAAEEADKKVARRKRHGKAKTGYQTQAVLKWKRAKEAFDDWDKAEVTLEQVRCALRPFTPQGELNSRERAEGQVKALAASLQGEQWSKFKRALARPETYAYLDRQQKQVEALPVSPEVREAVVQSEAVRQNPEMVKGPGAKQGAWRGLLLVYSVLIAKAGEAGKQAVLAMQRMSQTAGRSSSCVEGLNSVIRMQQSRHRKMTQELLDLKRLYWNLRRFRTGQRKDACPYRLLGLGLPPDLAWWHVLKLSPDQLRLVLSAPTPSP
jgi:hypothetical protein